MAKMSKKQKNAFDVSGMSTFAQDKRGSYNRESPDSAMASRSKRAKSVADSMSGRSATPRNPNTLSASGTRARAQMAVGDRDSFGTTWSTQTKKQKRTKNRQIRKATIKSYLGSK